MSRSQRFSISLQRELNLPAMQRAVGLMLARNSRPDSEITFGWRVD